MTRPKPKKPIKKHAKRLKHPDKKCPRHPKKDYRLLVEQAWRAGWWCEQRRKYIFCDPPDGGKRVKVPMTPHQRTLRNVKARFKDSGLEL